MDTKSKCAGNWDSERGSKKEKTKVDDDGKKGHHITKDKPMTVGCLADGMTWDVDDGDEHLHYSGDFDGEDHGLPHEDHVTGTCKTTKSKVESRKDQPTDDSEDWEGTKTT